MREEGCLTLPILTWSLTLGAFSLGYSVGIALLPLPEPSGDGQGGGTGEILQVEGVYMI